MRYVVKSGSIGQKNEESGLSRFLFLYPQRESISYYQKRSDEMNFSIFQSYFLDYQ